MGSIDRISVLPKELARHILCLMPTLDSVKTTVLSKRWNNFWTLVPNLDFDDERDFDFEYEFEDYDPFAIFVSRVLYFRDSSDIRKLRLNISFSHDLTRIEDWIFTAVRRKVVEFEFGFGVYDETSQVIFKLPECLIMCKTLRFMKLRLWPPQINFDPPASGCFPSLKSLHVTLCEYDIGPGQNLMEALVSCCSVLEDLTVDGLVETDIDDRVYNLKVSALELKTLRISIESNQILVDIYINAPKLENLYLEKVGLSNYFLMGSAGSLVNASIEFRDFEAHHRPYFSNCANALLKQVSNVKWLSVSAHWLEGWHLPAFGNLNQLRLVLWDCNYWEVLVEFLKSAPNLEDFDLEDRTKCEKEYSVVQWNPPEDVPICLSSHLKTISIRGFKIRGVEIEMMKYLIKYGPLLKKMMIYSDIFYTQEDIEDFYKEFSGFHETCEFHKM